MVAAAADAPTPATFDHSIGSCHTRRCRQMPYERTDPTYRTRRGRTVGMAIQMTAIHGRPIYRRLTEGGLDAVGAACAVVTSRLDGFACRPSTRRPPARIVCTAGAARSPDRPVRGESPVPSRTLTSRSAQCGSPTVRPSHRLNLFFPQLAESLELVENRRIARPGGSFCATERSPLRKPPVRRTTWSPRRVGVRLPCSARSDTPRRVLRR